MAKKGKKPAPAAQGISKSGPSSQKPNNPPKNKQPILLQEKPVNDTNVVKNQANVGKSKKPVNNTNAVNSQANVGKSKKPSSVLTANPPTRRLQQQLPTVRSAVEASINSQSTSIWSDEERTGFRRLVEDLHKIATRPGTPCTHDISVYQLRQEISETKYPARILNFRQEQQIADGFAFLASSSDEPGGVSAAIVEEHSNPTGLKIKIAANSGPAPEVSSSMQNIVSILERYARSQVNIKQTEILKSTLRSTEVLSQVFEEAINLNQERIRDRLRPRKVTEISMLRRIQKLNRGSAPKPTSTVSKIDKFKSKLKDFEKSYSMLLDSQGSDMTLVKTITRQAYDLTEQNESYDKVLFQTHFSQELRNDQSGARKILKKLILLGRYWGFCEFLVKLVRRTPLIFQNVEVLTLPNINPGGTSRYKVHGEVQLILHSELVQHKPPPRVMGSSKKACYLCNLFIQMHGQFFVSKTHGKLYLKWTVKSPNGLQMKSVSNIRDVLYKVQEEIIEEINRSRNKSKNNLEVCESSAGSLCSGLSDLTVSTIKNVPTVIDVPIIRTPSPLGLSNPTVTRPLNSRKPSQVIQNSAIASPGPSRLNLVINADDLLTPQESPKDTRAINEPTSSAECTPRVSGIITCVIEDDQISKISSMPSSMDLYTLPNLPAPAPTVIQRGKPSKVEVCKDCTMNLRAGSISKFVSFESPPDKALHNSSTLPAKSYRYGKAKLELITQEDVARDGLEVFRLEDLSPGEERVFPTSMFNGKDPTLQLCIGNGKDVLRVFCAWK